MRFLGCGRGLADAADGLGEGGEDVPVHLVDVLLWFGQLSELQ